VAGYEALVRWTHPERGEVAPSEFVALAEETSLIVPVGEYVLDAACALLAGLRRQVAEGLFIAVNVSARQLAAPGLVQRMLERLDDRGLPRGALKLELTESQGLDDERIARILHEAHAAGLALSLDDFGTGWSNLARLQRLPFETLKLDQAFIRQLHADPRSRALTEAVLAMARAIGAEVVVEGVESAGQLEALRALGCRFAQGYLIGRDLDAAAVLAAGA
jgi:EAL domain-containing protein (putative c-di-GMP-specific phosphodiesterase class I)